MQAVARKGVYVSEPADCALTETVLIKTNPLKMSAHMAVIEAIMNLFLKEACGDGKILESVRRFSKDPEEPGEPGELPLYWINQSCQALRVKLEDEKEENIRELPKFNKLQDISDLSDGIALTSVISLYCPDDFSWTEISFQDPTNVADCLRNIQLLQKFISETLPYNFCHLTTEDIFYMHNSIKLNMECMIADMFTTLELLGLSIVQLPGVKKDKIIQFQSLDSSSRFQSKPSSGEEQNFVVQKGRMIPTLSSVAQSHRSLSPGSELGQKERLNQDTKSEERGETDTPSLIKSNSTLDLGRSMQPAGRPSERSEQTSVTSYAGRRSRRNSTNDNQSQISLENIGGSMDNLSVIGRNPDKELRVHSGKKNEIMATPQRRGSANQQTFDIRKYGNGVERGDDVFLDNKELDAMEKLELNNSAHVDASSPLSPSSNNYAEKKTSFADLRKKSNMQNQFATSGIHITYTEGEEKENLPKKKSFDREKMFTENNPYSAQSPVDSSNEEMNDKLNSVRLKLEERRKRIEEERRKMDALMMRQKDTNNDESFGARTNYPGDRSERRSLDSENSSPSKILLNKNEDPNDPYSKSLLHMNDHISEMSNNLQRLAAQQTQIQQMMQRSPQQQQQQQPQSAYPPHPMDPQPYYAPSPEQGNPTQRRTWGQPQPISFAPAGGMGYDRPGWTGGHVPPSRPYSYDGSYGGYDQYMPRDQWGNPLPPAPIYGGSGYNMYNNGQQPYMPHPPYTTNNQYPSQYIPPTYPNMSPNPIRSGTNLPTTPQKSVPFRLHDSPSVEKELSPEGPHTSTPNPFTRQLSRDLVDSKLPAVVPRKLHAPVPAPAMDDMAPQNISFIESASDIEDVSPTPRKSSGSDESRTDGSLTDRLARLSLTRGDKTYRVQLHADGREPTTVQETSPTAWKNTNRPTISSTFKERRRGSNESGTGPMSLSGPNSLPSSAIQNKMTDEEVETLNNMKTELLNETGDPSKGFVISFDDDPKVKPKPVLKERKFSKRTPKEDPSSSDPVMIMLDMNEDLDSDHRDSSIRDKSGNRKNFREDFPTKYSGSAHWNSYDTDELTSPSENIIPKFNVDPDIPLEPMVELNDLSDSDSARATGLIIGDTMLAAGDDSTPNEMAKKKEKIMMQSLRRKQQAEENKIKREEKARLKKEEEAWKAEEQQRKKEEDARRKEEILKHHKMKKEQEKAEEEGRHFPSPISAKPIPKISHANNVKKTRPKVLGLDRNRKIQNSTSDLSHLGGSSLELRRSESRGSVNDSYDKPPTSRSTMSLATMGSRGQSGGGSRSYLPKKNPTPDPYGDSSPRSSRYDRQSRSASQPRGKRDSSVSSAYGAIDKGNRNDSFRGSRESLVSRRTYTARRGSNSSLYEDEDEYYYGGSLRDLSYSGHKGRRKSSSVSYLGPGSLPSRQRRGGDFDDGASDISSTASGWSAYGYRTGGSRLGNYREPSTKSNRPIVLNAIEHVVFPGVVNQETRYRVIEEIDACDCPHFLILFRDTKCQFRGLYAYYPDTEEVFKIYGTGPKQVTEKMFEKFFKYNSGGKKFTQIHTKSLTVTIDAFTIHNSLWLGKKAKLPDRRSMAMVV